MSFVTTTDKLRYVAGNAMAYALGIYAKFPPELAKSIALAGVDDFLTWLEIMAEGDDTID